MGTFWVVLQCYWQVWVGGQFIPTTGDYFSTQLTLSVVERCMRFYVNVTFETVDQTLFTRDH